MQEEKMYKMNSTKEEPILVLALYYTHPPSKHDFHTL